MTESTNLQPSDADTPVEAPTEPVETPEGEEAPEVAAQAQEDTQARDDLAEARTRGDQYFEALKLATLQAGAGDVVRAVSDMPADDPRYYDEAGFPSADGVRVVALELVAAKPHLGHVRGEVHQGAKETTSLPTWSEIMRSALG